MNVQFKSIQGLHYQGNKRNSIAPLSAFSRPCQPIINTEKTICESQSSQVALSLAQQSHIQGPPISSFSIQDVKSIVAAIIDKKVLHTKLSFDKIGLWEQFLAFNRTCPDPNIVAQFKKFECNEMAILKEPSTGTKRGGICSGHALYVQNELKKQGVDSYVVAKSSGAGGYEHAALAIRVLDDDQQLHILLIDPLQDPDFIDLKVGDEPVPYGAPFKSKSGVEIERMISIQNNQVVIQEIHPKTGEKFKSHFTTDRLVSITETVSKPHIFEYPKMPWTTHDTTKRGMPKSAVVMVNLAERNIGIKDIINAKECVLTLKDIRSIQNNKGIRSDLNHFVSDDFALLFGVSKAVFFNRLAYILSEESCFYFDKLHVNNSSVKDY